MIELSFDVMSSVAGGSMDRAVSLEDALETSEVISTATVTASDATILTIASVVVNTSELTQDGITIPIGKGITFNVTAAQAINDSRVSVLIHAEGDGNTIVDYDIGNPIKTRLTS